MAFDRTISPISFFPGNSLANSSSSSYIAFSATEFFAIIFVSNNEFDVIVFQIIVFLESLEGCMRSIHPYLLYIIVPEIVGKSDKTFSKSEKYQKLSPWEIRERHKCEKR